MKTWQDIAKKFDEIIRVHNEYKDSKLEKYHNELTRKAILSTLDEYVRELIGEDEVGWEHIKTDLTTSRNALRQQLLATHAANMADDNYTTEERNGNIYYHKKDKA